VTAAGSLPTTTSSPTSSSSGAGSAPATRRGGSTGGQLVTSQGRTQIADTVVTKIAGIAAREVNGVHRLGGGAARAFGAIRERIPGASTNVAQGVSVEVGEKQAAIDLDMVVEYGVTITELAGAIRRNVITALERMTGLEIVEVNINVQDVHLPEDDDDNGGSSSGGDRQPEPSRVR
jgi:uncharacterized alkaline shock family protein YloU